MERLTQSFYAPAESIDEGSSSIAGTSPLTAGLPATWWVAVQGFAGLVFSAFWMVESAQKSQSLQGITKINYMAQDAWGLLVTLACCYGVIQFWKLRSGTVGLILCALVAASAMAWHRS